MHALGYCYFNLAPHAILPNSRSNSKWIENFRQKGNDAPKNHPLVFQLLCHGKMWNVSRCPLKEVLGAQRDVTPST